MATELVEDEDDEVAVRNEGEAEVDVHLAALDEVKRLAERHLQRTRVSVIRTKARWTTGHRPGWTRSNASLNGTWGGGGG